MPNLSPPSSPKRLKSLDERVYLKRMGNVESDRSIPVNAPLSQRVHRGRQMSKAAMNVSRKSPLSVGEG